MSSNISKKAVVIGGSNGIGLAISKSAVCRFIESVNIELEASGTSGSINGLYISEIL